MIGPRFQQTVAQWRAAQDNVVSHKTSVQHMSTGRITNTERVCSLQSSGLLSGKPSLSISKTHIYITLCVGIPYLQTQIHALRTCHVHIACSPDLISLVSTVFGFKFRNAYRSLPARSRSTPSLLSYAFMWLLLNHFLHKCLPKAPFLE